MAGRPIRVLLVADDRTVADPLLAMIQKGAENEIACEWVDSIEGEGRLPTPREIDVVVAVLPLHGCNDLTPLDDIRALAPGVPALAITDQTHLEVLRSSTPTGAGAYLIKEQLDQATIRHAIRSAIECHRKALAASQKKTTQELKRTIKELYRVNQQVLDQQRSVIEEERLNLLVQIAGATAHKLNQPLMALLGSIDLMRINQDKPEKLARDVDRVEAAAQEIADIVQRIQTIQRDDTKPYLRDSVIIDLDQKLKVLVIIGSDVEFDQIEALVTRHPRIEVSRARAAADGTALLEKKRYDLILIDASLAGGTERGLLRYLFEGIFDTPVVVMTGEGEEMIASHLITAGAYDYLPKSQMTEEAFSRVITNVQEKFRLQREVEGVRRQMSRQSVTDQRTGLYNRRHFMETLEREMSRARRYGTVLVAGLFEPKECPLAVASLGDARNDALISMVGRLLRQEFRNSDFVCRYNTETIAVIFPHTNTDALGKRLEILRQAVAERVFVHGGEAVRLVVHIGISPFDPAGDEFASAFVEQAEAALVVAKKRDKVFAGGTSR